MIGEATSKDGLGLPVGAVRLEAHQPAWLAAFEREAARLREALGDLILSIEHVGSTCVAGLQAKPIIDMAAAIASFDRVSALIAPLKQMDYEHLGDRIVPGHHVFAKGSLRTHLLHVVELDGERWRGLLAFRDLLLHDPSAAANYELVKIELARRFATDRRAYREAKRAYVDPLVAALVQSR